MLKLKVVVDAADDDEDDDGLGCKTGHNFRNFFSPIAILVLMMIMIDHKYANTIVHQDRRREEREREREGKC